MYFFPTMVSISFCTPHRATLHMATKPPVNYKDKTQMSKSTLKIKHMSDLPGLEWPVILLNRGSDFWGAYLLNVREYFEVDKRKLITGTQGVSPTWLTHWGWGKMADLQLTFSNAIPSMEINDCILIKISLKFVPKGPNDNMPALVQEQQELTIFILNLF